MAGRSTAERRAAYQQARARYEQDTTSPQAISALGWVYADLLREPSEAGDTDRMLRGLALISAFPMVDDARWRQSVGWSICRFLLRHTPTTLPLSPLAEVIRRAEAFVPAEAGLLRSVWWRALLRHTDTGLDWVGLFDRHGWDNGFRPDDELPELYGNGKTARPLVQGLIQAVARQLLQTIVLTRELATPWLERLARLGAAHPDWEFIPYYRARLLIRLDRRDEAMRVFLPFARLKKNDFWVWSLLAELVDAEHVPACYARALSLGTPEAFLVKVRQQLAGWLIGQNRWADARAEIDQLVRTRQQNQWPIPDLVSLWTLCTDYRQATASPAGHWYADRLPEADALLWTDLPETVALVTGVDDTGRYVNIALDRQTVGSFPAAMAGGALTTGHHVALRYSWQEKNGRRQLRVHTAIRTDAPLTYLTTRTLTGPLRLNAGKTIGFVGDVYVPATLLTASALPADTRVVVDAVTAWDAVKQKDGWRAFRIEKESVNLSV